LSLASALYLSAGRANEVLRMQKSQFRLFPDDPEIMVCSLFQVSKRKRKFLDKKDTELYRKLTSKTERDEFAKTHAFTIEKPTIEIPMPLVGPLSSFSLAIQEYLKVCKTEKLFNISKSRALGIISWITSTPEQHMLREAEIENDPTNQVGKTPMGKWLHWFRSQQLSYSIELLRSTTLVAEDKGISNVNTLKHYQASRWSDHKDDYKRGLSKTVGTNIPTLPLATPISNVLIAPSVPQNIALMPTVPIIQSSPRSTKPKFTREETEKRIQQLELRLKRIEKCQTILNSSSYPNELGDVFMVDGQKYSFTKYPGGWKAFLEKYEPLIESQYDYEYELLKLQESLKNA
jgi:hypothetical protein